MEILQYIIDTFNDNVWFHVVTAAIALAAAVTAVIKPKEGSKLEKVFKVVNWLALNIGKAKNQAEEKKEES